MAVARRLAKVEELLLMIDQTLALEGQVQQMLFRPMQSAAPKRRLRAEPKAQKPRVKPRAKATTKAIDCTFLILSCHERANLLMWVKQSQTTHLGMACITSKIGDWGMVYDCFTHIIY